VYSTGDYLQGTDEITLWGESGGQVNAATDDVELCLFLNYSVELCLFFNGIKYMLLLLFVLLETKHRNSRSKATFPG